MTTRGLCALTAVLLLAACGGGGGGGGPATDMPEMPADSPGDTPDEPMEPPAEAPVTPTEPPSATPPTPSEPPLADGVPADGEEMLAAVGPSLPSVLPTAKVWFGSASLSAGPDVTGVNSSFDGRRTVVTVERGSAATVTLDSNDSYLPRFVGGGTDDESVFGGLTNRLTRQHYLFTNTDDSATAGRVVVDWNDDDPADYAVGGYWMHGDASSTAWEFGAFVDGPELSLSDPPTLPGSGKAVYEGDAGGMLAAEKSDGSHDVLHFNSNGRLIADFDAGTVEGCIGCLFGITYRGLVVDLGSVPFDRSDGTFQGSNATLSRSAYGVGLPIAQSSGHWAGQFSNIPHESGVPRLAAGTFDSTGTTTSGLSVSVFGAFGVGHDPVFDGEVVWEAARPSLHDLLPESKVWFGSTSLSAGPDVTDVSSSFDGQDAVVTIDRGNADAIRLDTADTSFDGGGRRGALFGDQFYLSADRSVHHRFVVDDTGSSATSGHIIVDWSSGDPTDYLAAGYWLQIDEDSAVSVGAFVDGPELSLSDPPTLPNLGTATYDGQARGRYVLRTAFRTVDGNLHSDARLTADFAAGTIEGCIGCDSVFSSDGGAGGLQSTHLLRGIQHLNLGSVAFDRSNGTFQGNTVTVSGSVSDVDLPVTQTRGSWAGQFSNNPDSSGAPRLVAGTFEATQLLTEDCPNCLGGPREESFSVIGVFGAVRSE